MQHPLAKSPISAREIGDFVACGRIIERQGGSEPPPLFFTHPLPRNLCIFSVCTILQQALFLSANFQFFL